MEQNNWVRIPKNDEYNILLKLVTIFTWRGVCMFVTRRSRMSGQAQVERYRWQTAILTLHELVEIREMMTQFFRETLVTLFLSFVRGTIVDSYIEIVQI